MHSTDDSFVTARPYRVPEMPPSLDEVIEQPDWICFGLDRDRLLLHFARMDEAAIEAMVFLGQLNLHSFASIDFPVEEVLERLPAATHAEGSRFILHTAFCCSTLLARCVDYPGKARTLRELPVLSGLAPLRLKLLTEGKPELWNSIVLAIDRLASRPFALGSVTLNKPSNVFLPAARDFLGRNSESRALVIHSDLPGFLVSCAKKQSAGVDPWLAMLVALDPDGSYAAGHSLDVARLAPMEIACVVWNLEMQLLRGMEGLSAQVTGIDAPAFLAAPLETVHRAQAWFGYDVPEAGRAATVDRELRRHAKQPDAAFDPARRESEKCLAERLFGAEMEKTLKWNRRRFGDWREVCRSAVESFPPLLG